MTRTLHTRWFGLFAVTLLVACGGDSDPVDPPAQDYRPWETVTQIQDVVGPVISSENALLGIEAAGTALVQFSAQPAAALLRLGQRSDLRAMAGDIRQVRSTWSTEVAFPAAVEGRTLVWNVEDRQYEVDEARTGAPEEGVRVVYYAMNPVTNEPAEPLLELGHIDLTDEDVTGEERLGIRVVDSTPESGPVELLDYTIGFTGEGGASEGHFTFTAVGVHSGTTFDLLQAFTWSEAENTDALTLDYQYSVADASVRFRMDASSGFEAPTWTDVDLRVDVNDGEEDVVLEVAIGASGALDGEVRVDDAPAVSIGGVDGNPTFSYPGGGQLSGNEVESLRDLWNLVTNVLDLTNALIAPGTLLLLPG